MWKSLRNFFCRRWKLLCLTIIVLLIIWGLLRFFGIWGTPKAPQQQPDFRVAVATKPVIRENFPIYVTAIGTVSSYSSVALLPQVSGRLTTINVAEGQHVSKGQVIATIDDRSYRAAVDQARGEVAQIQAQLTTAEEDLQRYQQLGAASAISRQKLDTQRQLVRQYQGQLVSSQSNLKQAEVNLSYTVLKAPTDGIVGIRNIDPGNLVSSGSSIPIMTITQQDPISVIFSLPAQYRNQIRQQLQQNNTAVKLIDADGITPIADGKLVSLDSEIDSATGTLRMRAEFNNANGELFPNQFVNVRLLLKTLPNVNVIPEVALQSAQDGLFVYLVNPAQTIERQAVTLLGSSDYQVAIGPEVQPGQQVVVDGVDNLHEGMPVKVVSHELPGGDASENSTPAVQPADSLVTLDNTDKGTQSAQSMTNLVTTNDHSVKTQIIPSPQSTDAKTPDQRPTPEK